MKRISLTTLAAGLLLATAALAEPPKDLHHGAPPGGHPGGGPPPHGTPSGGHPGGGGPMHGPMHGPMGGGGPMHGPMGGGGGGGGTHVYTGGRPSYQHDARGFGMRPTYWNQRPREFDRTVYQVNITVAHPFSWGVYVRPSGWYYRRWGYGDVLPPIFWGPNYWIASWWMFDLPIPPYGYEWVRYGNDAILVNTTTGQIVQVQYGLFY